MICRKAVIFNYTAKQTNNLDITERSEYKNTKNIIRTKSSIKNKIKRCENFDDK